MKPRNAPLAHKTRLVSRKELAPGQPIGRKKAEPGTRTANRGTGRKDTGFSLAVKAAVRERARYRCEACGVYLGQYGGQLQHRLARRMGGSRSPLLSSPVNGALLCGTPSSGCHGRCESRDRDMQDAGFWLESWQSPLEEPVMLHGNGSGITVWLTEDGAYSLERIGAEVISS